MAEFYVGNSTEQTTAGSPASLLHALEEYKRELREDVSCLDCLWGELYSSINDRSGLKRNGDGSVDVILSKDAPADTTNWLPVADGGFHLFMRIYTPDMEALKTWTAPTITAIG